MMHLKYAEMLATVVHESMKLGDNNPLIMRGSDKESANCSPYFSALQYINNLETQNILL